MVGLSGGVDSAVTAHLLKQQGHEVIGIFMKNSEDDVDSEFRSSNIDFVDAATGLHELLKGLDPAKDQSYFLHRLNQAQLSKTLFPVGELRKTEVRRIADEIGLPNAKKKDSTGTASSASGLSESFLTSTSPWPQAR